MSAAPSQPAVIAVGDRVRVLAVRFEGDHEPDRRPFVGDVGTVVYVYGPDTWPGWFYVEFADHTWCVASQVERVEGEP